MRICVPNPAELDRPLYTPDDGDGWHVDRHYDAVQRHQWIEAEWVRCAISPMYFATHYCYTVNEHLDDSAGVAPSVELIPSWPHVEAFFDAWSAPCDVIIEKSRDMALSWISMAGLLHDILFRQQWAAMTLSRTESLVDDGGEASTVDSLHGKIRFMYEQLPWFLRDAQPLTFRHLKIRNELTRSHITGFSATPSAGRGPKWKRAVLDEFAWVQWSEAVMSSVSRACPRGKCIISTPHGKANAFFRIRDGAKCIWPGPSRSDNRHAHWDLMTVHWSQHPDRDEQWYEQQCDSMTVEAVAQELDISYTRSIGRRVYPRFVSEAHVAGCTLAPRGVDLHYDPVRPLLLCCDFNPDPLVWEIVQPHAVAPQWRVIAEICRRNAVVDDAVLEFVVRYGARKYVEQLLSDNPGYRQAYGQFGICQAGDAGHTGQVTIYGDATEEKSTVYSRVKIYQHMKHELGRHGFGPVRLLVPPSNPPIRLRIETVNDALSKAMVLVHPSCEQLRRDFEEGHYDTAGKDMRQSTDDDGSGLTRSHSSSALGYLLTRVHHVRTSAIAPTSRHRDPPELGKLLPSFVRAW